MAEILLEHLPSHIVAESEERNGFVFDEKNEKDVIEEALVWLDEHPGVGEVLVTGGDPMIMPDDAMALLGDTSSLWLWADVYERDIAEIGLALDRTRAVPHRTGGAYLAQALSGIDIMTALLHRFVRTEPARDRFLLSPGHYALPLYVCLADLGYFDPELLEILAGRDSITNREYVDLVGVSPRTGNRDRFQRESFGRRNRLVELDTQFQKNIADVDDTLVVGQRRPFLKLGKLLANHLGVGPDISLGMPLGILSAVRHRPTPRLGFGPSRDLLRRSLFELLPVHDQIRGEGQPQAFIGERSKRRDIHLNVPKGAAFLDNRIIAKFAGRIDIKRDLSTGLLRNFLCQPSDFLINCRSLTPDMTEEIKLLQGQVLEPLVKKGSRIHDE